MRWLGSAAEDAAASVFEFLDCDVNASSVVSKTLGRRPPALRSSVRAACLDGESSRRKAGEVEGRELAKSSGLVSAG